MSSDGFKVPSLPMAGSKRKQPEEPNGRNTGSKRSRPTVEDDSPDIPSQSSVAQPKRTYNFAPSIPIKSTGSVTTDLKGKAREVLDEDDVMGDEGDETFEADAGDEEGRFFGGGTNRTQEVSTHQLYLGYALLMGWDSKSWICLPVRKMIWYVPRAVSGLWMLMGVQGSGLPTVQELRRHIIKFERIVQKNTEMRARFADDPSK
jgi:hypothetical protein